MSTSETSERNTSKVYGIKSPPKCAAIKYISAVILLCAYNKKYLQRKSFIWQCFYNRIAVYQCLNRWNSNKGTVPRDFRLRFFSVNPPSPWLSYQGCFEFFRKFAEIFATQGAPPVLLTLQMEKSSIWKVLIILFGVNIYINIFL